MVATYAQKQAAERYRKKKSEQGFKQHQVFCDDLHWQVLSPLYRWINNLDFSTLKTVNFDDNGEFIKFLYDKEQKSDDRDTKDTTDDITHPKE